MAQLPPPLPSLLCGAVPLTLCDAQYARSMLASAGGLFTSLLSWTIPQSVQKRVVYYFLRNTLGRFLSSTDLNSPDSFDFHDGAFLLHSLEFDISAVQEILPIWTPSIKILHIESIRVQLPWPNIFTGTVHVNVQAPRAFMTFKDKADPVSSPESPELKIDNPSILESDIPQQSGNFEHSDVAFETSQSTLENLVTSFGNALVQRLNIFVEDVDIRVAFKNGAVVLKVQEFSFDGEKENMSCTETLIQAFRPRSFTDCDCTSAPAMHDASLGYPLFESDDPGYIVTDILRIKECMEFHVQPGNTASNTEPLIILEVPHIDLLASYYDILFCFALTQTLLYSLQTSSGSSENTLDLSIGTTSIRVHISCLNTLFLFEEEHRTSKENLGAHLAVECQNLIVEAHYDGSRITSSTSQIERFLVHEVFKDATRSLVIRINGKHENADAIPSDYRAWALGSCRIGQGDWSSINALPSSLDQGMLLTQSGPSIHLHMAPAQLLIDLEMIHRVLPLLQLFSTSCSSSSEQEKASIPWSYVHGILFYLPIMTISCEKAQMALRVPEAQMSEATYVFQSPRSGLWFIECDDIHTLNSRTQELPSSECVHVDTSRVSIYQSSDYESARYLCAFGAGNATDAGIQIDINLSSILTEGCTANIHLDVPDLVIGIDNPFMHSIYYLADDFLKYATSIATSWTQTLQGSMLDPIKSVPGCISEPCLSLESFWAATSIQFSIHLGKSTLADPVHCRAFTPDDTTSFISSDLTISSQLGYAQLHIDCSEFCISDDLSQHTWLRPSSSKQGILTSVWYISFLSGTDNLDVDLHLHDYEWHFVENNWGASYGLLFSPPDNVFQTNETRNPLSLTCTFHNNSFSRHSSSNVPAQLDIESFTLQWKPSLLCPSTTSLEIIEAFLHVDRDTCSFPLGHIINGHITHTFWKNEHTMKFDSIHGSFGFTPELISHLNYTMSQKSEEISVTSRSDEKLKSENSQGQNQEPNFHLVVSNTNIQFGLYSEYAPSDPSPCMKLCIEGLELIYEGVPGFKSDLTVSIHDAWLINEIPHTQFKLPISWSRCTDNTSKNHSLYLHALLEHEEASQAHLSLTFKSGPVRLCINPSIIAFLISFFPQNMVNADAPIHISKVDISSLEVTLDYESNNFNARELLQWPIWGRLNLLTFKESRVHLRHILAVDIWSLSKLGDKIMESWAPDISPSRITSPLDKIVPLPVHSSTGHNDINLILLPNTDGEHFNYTKEAIQETMQRALQLPPGTLVYLEPHVPLVGGSMVDVWAGSISSRCECLSHVTTMIAVVTHQIPSDDDLESFTLRAIPIASL